MRNSVLTDSSYDPEFGDWEFGKLSALREIALATEGSHQYYYMGTSLAVNTAQFLISARLLHTFMRQDAVQSQL